MVRVSQCLVQWVFAFLGRRLRGLEARLVVRFFAKVWVCVRSINLNVIVHMGSTHCLKKSSCLKLCFRNHEWTLIKSVANLAKE